MSKILFFVALAVLVYFLLQKQRKVADKQDQTQQKAGTASESMVRCAYCKLHIPLTESIEQGSRHYCSEEHRRLHGGHGGT